MNHLVIDLEMCKVPKHCRTKAYKYADETIQIGAVLLDDDYRQVSCEKWYVRPEYGFINHFIEELTGISQKDTQNASSIETVLVNMISWVGDNEYDVCTWSESDRKQLLHEVEAKQITREEINGFLNNVSWIDYQEVFSNRFDYTRRINLEEAMMMADVDISGRLHDGLDDAINTGKLVTKLETEPDFKLSNYIMTEESKPFGCTLGDLFAGLVLETA